MKQLTKVLEVFPMHYNADGSASLTTIDSPEGIDFYDAWVRDLTTPETDPYKLIIEVEEISPKHIDEWVRITSKMYQCPVEWVEL